MNIQSNLKYIVPEEKYNKFAGDNWPTYEVFVLGNNGQNQQINDEIKSLVDDSLNYIEDQYKVTKKFCINNFILKVAAPAIIGVVFFIVTSAAWYKLLYLIPLAFVVDILWANSVHKWITHKQFEPKPLIKIILLWIFTIPGYHKIKFWALAHLYHHIHSDTIEDPYTPRYGFLCLLVGAHKCQNLTNYIEKHRLTFLVPKEIEFIDKYQFPLYICNLILFFLIDPDLFLLSFILFKFYAAFSTALNGYVLHSGLKSEATNLKWYWSFILFGERLHKKHHENPKILNLTKSGRKNLYYYYIKIIAKK